MFCPNCGKSLEEGEVCTCQQQNNQPSNESYQQNYYNQNQQNPQDTYYNPNINYSQGGSYSKPITDYPDGYKQKKKYVAVILAITLGMFGIHNFYLGYNSKGLIQVLLTTLGAILFGLGPFAVAIWVTVEFVQLLCEKIDTDANGYKIETFDDVIERCHK